MKIVKTIDIEHPDVDAENGKITEEAMRFYNESGMSKDEFNKAVKVGMNLNKWIK